MTVTGDAAPSSAPFGLTCESADGHATVRVRVDASMHNPNGVVHGGVLCTVLDWGMGAATQSVLAAGKFCATIDIHLRFLQAVSQGELRADVDVVRAGKRVVTLEGKVYDEQSNLLATATGAFAVLGGS